jgi:hypothetical protein
VAIRASGNVSSITDNGVGNYTVNFTTAMPNANYGAVGTGGSDGAGTAASHVKVFLIDRTTSDVRLISQNDDGSGTQDANALSVAIFR